MPNNDWTETESIVYNAMNSLYEDQGQDTGGVLSGFNAVQQQSMSPQDMTPVPQDTTIAGGIQQSVGGAVASAVEFTQDKPLIGFMTNTALSVSQWLDTNLISPLSRAAATGVMMLTDADKTDSTPGLLSAERYWNASKDISFGQAAWAPVFLPSGGLLDKKTRVETFEDSWLGLIASGGTDLGLAMLGSKGTSLATKGAKTALLGSNKMKDIASLRNLAEDAVAWGEAAGEAAAPSSFASLLDDAVKETSADKLRYNPLIANSANPDRMATLMAGVGTHRSAAELFMADHGDLSALNRLRDDLPLAHDALTNFGHDITEPLDDWSSIHKLPDPLEAKQYQKVLDALAAKDKQFARQLDAFMNDTSNAKYLSDWKPGRFAGIEQAKMFGKRAKAAAVYGSLDYLKPGKGWVVEERMGDRYTRGIRFFQWAASGRPQGHINVSNPRPGEAAQDLLSELNQYRFLREDVQFKQKAVEMFTRAVDDNERALALDSIEQQLMIKLAKHYDVGGLRSIADAGGDIAEQTRFLQNMYDEMASRRDSATAFLKNNGFINDPDGNLSFVKGVNFRTSIISRSGEPETVPMLDFRRLEAELVHNLEVAQKSPNMSISNFNLSKGDVLASHLYRNKYVTGLQQFGDIANMVFSNLHLLRLAFIPKNSMLDPWMRASMATESIAGLSGGLAGQMIRSVGNNMKRRTNMVMNAGRSRWSAEAKALDSDLTDIKADWGMALASIGKNQKAIRKSEARIKDMSSRVKAIKGKDPDSAVARKDLQDKLVREQDRLDSLRVDAEDLRTKYDTIAEARRGIIEQRALMTSRVFDDKAAIEYAGKEKFVYITKDGEKIEMGGAFDPAAKGASAYRAEADSWTNYYASNLESGSALRNTRQSKNFDEIVPDFANPERMASYWSALERYANKRVRNELDEVLGPLLRGDSVDDVAKWLKTTSDGREYLMRISHSIANVDYRSLSDDVLMSWLNTTQMSLMKMFPSANLREIILKRNVDVSEIKAHLDGYDGQLPTIYGPHLESVFAGKGMGEKAVVGLEEISRKGWKVISRVEDKLVRYPLFRQYWSDEVKAITQTLEAQGTNITYDLMNGAIRQQAYRRALVRVEQTLYSSRRMTNAGYAMRYMMAFPAAFFNSQKVALKSMARNPWNAYWYNSINTLMDKNLPFLGSYYEDREGNVYEKLSDVPNGVDVSVRVMLPKAANEFLAEHGMSAYLDPELGGMRIPQKQLQFMLGDPGLSWIGTMGLSEVIKHAGIDLPLPGNVNGMQIIDHLKSTFGEDFYNNSIMFQGNLVKGDNPFEVMYNAAIPTTYRQLLTAAFGDAGTDMLAEEANRLYRVQYREWINNNQDPAFKPDYEQSLAAAREALRMRAFINWSMPLSTSFDPASREAMSTMSKLVDKYEGNPDAYEMATDEFVSIYGMGGLALLGSSTTRPIGQAATRYDQNILMNHRDLIKNVIKNGGSYDAARIMFWSEKTQGNEYEYDSSLAEIQNQMGIPGSAGEPLNQTKTAKQVRDDIEQRVGWYEYGKLDQWRQAQMQAYAISSTGSAFYGESGIASRFKAAEEILRKKYPAWDADRKFNADGWWVSTGEALRTITSDKKFMKMTAKSGDLWENVSAFLNMSDAAKKAYDSTGYDYNKQYIRGKFEEYYYGMLASYGTDFSLFASRWLSSHPFLSDNFSDKAVAELS